MTEENNSDYKRGLGKIYEKVQMIKNCGTMLTVGFAINTETKRREVVLILKQEDGAITPLASLWSAEDFKLREYDSKDSLILERVFNLYQAEDNRESYDDLNDGYHPKDKNYDDMWKFIDSAREAVEDENPKTE